MDQAHDRPILARFAGIERAAVKTYRGLLGRLHGDGVDLRPRLEQVAEEHRHNLIALEALVGGGSGGDTSGGSPGLPVGDDGIDFAIAADWDGDPSRLPTVFGGLSRQEHRYEALIEGLVGYLGPRSRALVSARIAPGQRHALTAMQMLAAGAEARWGGTTIH